jgi:hypothetical protein
MAAKKRRTYEQETTEYKPPYDVIADLFELGQDGEEIDAEARRPLEDELVRRFVSSPEAKTLSPVQWCRCLMDLGANYFGATVATLGAPQLREVVFEVIPRQVSIKARAAGEIIDELSAFYARFAITTEGGQDARRGLGAPQEQGLDVWQVYEGHRPPRHATWTPDSGADGARAAQIRRARPASTRGEADADQSIEPARRLRARSFYLAMREGERLVVVEHVEAARSQIGLQLLARAARPFDLQWLARSKRKRQIHEQHMLLDEVPQERCAFATHEHRCAIGAVAVPAHRSWPIQLPQRVAMLPNGLVAHDAPRRGLVVVFRGAVNRRSQIQPTATNEIDAHRRIIEILGLQRMQPMACRTCGGLELVEQHDRVEHTHERLRFHGDRASATPRVCRDAAND